MLKTAILKKVVVLVLVLLLVARVHVDGWMKEDGGSGDQQVGVRRLPLADGAIMTVEY
jgi:hypothetical protein